MIRCASLTPSIASYTPGSNSSRPPTPPSTVWITPVERCTSKPSSVSRPITRSICSSVACCCITTSIGLTFLAFYSGFLNPPHLIDDAFENTLHRVIRQRPRVVRRYVPVDLVLTLRLIDRHARFSLHAPDLLYNSGSLINRFQDLQIESVNALTALAEGAQ